MAFLKRSVQLEYIYSFSAFLVSSSILHCSTQQYNQVAYILRCIYETPSDLDMCSHMEPCLEGNCTSTGPDSYSCACSDGFHGVNCSSQVEPEEDPSGMTAPSLPSLMHVGAGAISHSCDVNIPELDLPIYVVARLYLPTIMRC